MLLSDGEPPESREYLALVIDLILTAETGVFPDGGQAKHQGARTREALRTVKLHLLVAERAAQRTAAESAALVASLVQAFGAGRGLGQSEDRGHGVRSQRIVGDPRYE